MDALFFLCVLSMLHVAKLDVVYVHGDMPPTGEYWDLLIDTSQNVQFVLRENAREVCSVYSHRPQTPPPVLPRRTREVTFERPNSTVVPLARNWYYCTQFIAKPKAACASAGGRRRATLTYEQT